MVQFAASNALSTAENLTRLFIASNPGTSSADAVTMLMSVHAALVGIQQAAPTEVAPEIVSAMPTLRTPAVAIEDSVHEDYIISLETGRRFKMLKRHLTMLGMTPNDYIQKWNLPHDYPMCASSYRAKKQGEAFAVGLGTTMNKMGGMTREMANIPG